MKPNGGPAFPHSCEDFVNGERVGGSQFAGMSLRDYFAAKASDEDIAEIVGEVREIGTKSKTRQQARYIHADNMLAERNK